MGWFDWGKNRKRRKKDSILTVLCEVRWKSAGIVPSKVLLIGKQLSSQPLIIGKPSSQPGFKQETMLRSWSEYRYKAPTHHNERWAFPLAFTGAAQSWPKTKQKRSYSTRKPMAFIYSPSFFELSTLLRQWSLPTGKLPYFLLLFEGGHTSSFIGWIQVRKF